MFGQIIADNAVSDFLRQIEINAVVGIFDDERARHVHPVQRQHNRFRGGGREIVQNAQFDFRAFENLFQDQLRFVFFDVRAHNRNDDAVERSDVESLHRLFNHQPAVGMCQHPFRFHIRESV